MTDVTLTPTLTISATAPATPTPGDLWWNSAIGVFFVYYDDGSSVQWVTTQPVKYVNIAELKAPAGGDLTGYYPDPSIEDNVALEYPVLRNPLDLLDYSERLTSSKWVADKFAASGILGQVTSGPGILLTPDPMAGDSTIALRPISPPLDTVPVYGATNSTAVFSINEFGQIVAITQTPIPPVDSPIFTGTPRAPTAGPGTNDTTIATAQFVGNALTAILPNYALINSPTFTGDPKAPTPSLVDNDTSIATTAFVKGQLYQTAPDVAAALAPYALINSPTFTGDPKAPTPATADNDTSIATTAFVKAQAYATLASPTFTGDPKAPTPAASDNDTSIATTAFVQAAIAAALATVAGIPTGTVLDLAGNVAAPAGWVLAMNGTIGNAASGATIRANADCANLFAHLWTLANTEAPVSGGRGASAAADFAANKTIGGLDFRGAARATFDSQGGTPAGRLTTLFPRIGMIAGEQDHLLTIAEIPSHTHGVRDFTGTGSASTAAGGFNYTTVNSGPAGGGASHNNVQVTRTVTTIIKL